MPDYGSHPIEGYDYGNPRPGLRYRNPGGDRRVLVGIVSLFGLAALAVLGAAVLPRLQGPDSLAEAGFGWDDRSCRLETTWELERTFDLQAALDYRDFRDASKLHVWLSAVPTTGSPAKTGMVYRFDETFDWEASSLTIPVSLDVPEHLRGQSLRCRIEVIPS